MLLEEHPLPKGKDTNPHHHRQGFLEAQPQSRVQGIDPHLWQTAVAGHAHKPHHCPRTQLPGAGKSCSRDPLIPRRESKNRREIQEPSHCASTLAQTKDRSNSSSLELLSLLQKKTNGSVFPDKRNATLMDISGHSQAEFCPWRSHQTDSTAISKRRHLFLPCRALSIYFCL